MAVRPAAIQAGTRICPHCKAQILESAVICPGCKHHLRFGSEAQQAAALAPRTAWRVEGTLNPEGENVSSEYCILISVRNERNEEVARHVVNVGALQGQQQRTFTLSVDVSPPKPLGTTRRR